MQLNSFILSLLLFVMAFSVAQSTESNNFQKNNASNEYRREDSRQADPGKFAENFFTMLRSKDAAARTALESGDSKEYFAACDQIIQTDPKFLVATYSQALSDPDPYIREQAGSLIVASSAFARGTLNQQSLSALERLGNLLVEHAAETDVRIRLEAITALQWLAPHVPNQTFNLFSGVIDHESNSDIRKQAVVGIARFGPNLPRVSDILNRVAKNDPDPDVRSVAQQILTSPNAAGLIEPTSQDHENQDHQGDKAAKHDE